MRTPLTAIALSLVALVAPAASPAFQNEPDGFRGIKWGTPFGEAKDSLKFLEEDGGVKYYTRNGDTLTLGNAKLEAVKYGFYREKFTRFRCRSEVPRMLWP